MTVLAAPYHVASSPPVPDTLPPATPPCTLPGLHTVALLLEGRSRLSSSHEACLDDTPLDARLLRILGLSHCQNLRLSPAVRRRLVAGLRQARRALRDARHDGRLAPAPWQAGLQRLGRRLALTPAEEAVLGFMLALRTDPVARAWALLRPLSADGSADLLARVLELPFQHVARALRADGVLAREVFTAPLPAAVSLLGAVEVRPLVRRALTEPGWRGPLPVGAWGRILAWLHTRTGR